MRPQGEQTLLPQGRKRFPGNAETDGTKYLDAHARKKGGGTNWTEAGHIWYQEPETATVPTVPLKEHQPPPPPSPTQPSGKPR